MMLIGLVLVPNLNYDDDYGEEADDDYDDDDNDGHDDIDGNDDDALPKVASLFGHDGTSCKLPK